MRMFSFFTGRFKLLLVLKIAFAGYAALQGQAYAYVGEGECRFAEGYGNTATLTGGSTFGVHWRPYNSRYAIESLVTFRVPISPSMTSHCSAGNDGRNLVVKNPSDYTYTSGSGPQPDGSMGNYYLTNIPGIVFSVKMRSPAGGGYFGDHGSEQYSGWTTLVEASTDIWDNQAWEAEVTIWQDSWEFQRAGGNKNNATYITPAASFTLGQMGLGDPTAKDNKPWTFNVTPSSFQIPIVPSTCQTAQLDSGSTNIDLGEYMMSDFNVSPRSTPVRVQLLGCDNVYAVDFKMTATTTTGSNHELLGNVLTGGSAASGVGVQLFLTNGGVTIPPNGLATTVYGNDTGAGVGLGMLTFDARLIKDGNAMKAGSFKAMTTFQMTYY
ncbi:fimbrial protein [Enterobacter bugandensis]